MIFPLANLTEYIAARLIYVWEYLLSEGFITFFSSHGNKTLKQYKILQVPIVLDQEGEKEGRFERV